MSREFDELLSAYLDGEVSPEERAAVERRLEQSPQLRETLDELSEVGDLIRKLPRARAPIDLPERVVAAIAPKPLASTTQARRKSRRAGAWPLMAAGTVLAAGVAIVLFLPRPPRDAVDGLALNPVWLGTEGEIASRPEPSGLAADSDGSTRTALGLAMDSGGGRGSSETTESLTDYLRRLGRKPQPGEVYKTLEDNAGRTLVRQYTVVDTKEVADRMRTILIGNSMNVIETETPLPQEAAAAAPDSGSRLVYYMEGPPEQVGQALDELESLSLVREVVDLGVLADNTSEAFVPEALADNEARTTYDFNTSLPRDKAAGNPPAGPAAGQQFAAPLGAAPKPASPPEPASAPAFATKAAADARLSKELQSDSAVESKAGEAVRGKALAPGRPRAALTDEPPMPATSNAPQPAAEGYVGISAQLDSNAPIVQDVLRARAAGNLFAGDSPQGNAAQGNAFRENSGKTQSPGQVQNHFRSVRSLPFPQEQLGRKLSQSVSEEHKLNEGKGGNQKQQAGSAGRAAAEGPTVLNAAILANPRNAASQAHLLLIIESQAPAAPAVSEPTPAKKAGD